MASSLVVVAYDYAAAHMHIRHGETGVLVPYGEPEVFVTTATDLARRPEGARDEPRAPAPAVNLTVADS